MKEWFSFRGGLWSLMGTSSIPLEKGHIGLQAEWAELMYRNILIKELPQK